MIAVDVRRVVRAEDVAATTSPAVARAMNRQLVRVAGEARRNVQTGGITATGALARSMQGGAAIAGPARVDGWIGGEPYWPFVEAGTRPHMPPIDPLVKWVRSKKLIAQGALPVVAGRSRAYAIARSIASRRGSGKPPPVDAILAWMAKRGIRVNREDAERALAWAIAMKIEQRGTDAQPFVEPALDRLWSELCDEVMAVTALGDAR